MVKSHKVKEPSPVPHQGPHSSRRHGESTALGFRRHGMAATPSSFVREPLLLPILPERVCCRGASRLLWAALMDDPVAPNCEEETTSKGATRPATRNSGPHPLPKPCSLEATIPKSFSSSVSGVYHHYYHYYHYYLLNNNVISNFRTCHIGSLQEKMKIQSFHVVTNTHTDTFHFSSSSYISLIINIS